MAITTAQYAIGTSATQIVPDNIEAEEVHIHTAGTGIIYVGDSSVTTSTGYALDAGDKQVFRTHLGAMYAISAVTTGTLSIAIVGM